MMTPWQLMAVAGAVEAKALLRPHCRTLGRTLTSKESYICTSCSMWLAAEDRVESGGDEGVALYDVEAFMRVNLLLLNEQMWEAESK
uniref:Uncharacterized protein n=1 Tax=Oryza glumipatula TaxID=40148 RepID=A0A0E0B888_9ORYZ